VTQLMLFLGQADLIDMLDIPQLHSFSTICWVRCRELKRLKVVPLLGPKDLLPEDLRQGVFLCIQYFAACFADRCH